MDDSENSAEKIERLMKRPEVLKRQLKEARSHIDQLKKSNKVYKDANESLDGEYDSLLSKNKTLNSRLDKLSEENESTVEKMTKELKMSDKSALTMKDKVESLSDKNEKLNKQYDKLVGQNAELKKEVKSIGKENQSLSKELADAKEMAAGTAESKMQLTEARDKNAAMLKQQEQLRKDLKNSMASSDQFKSIVFEHQKSIELLEKKLQERNLAFDTIEKQNVEFAEKLSLMNERPKEDTSENDRLNSLMSSMKDQNKTLAETNEGLNDLMEELEAESKALRENNQSLTTEVSKLKAEINASLPEEESSSNDSSNNHSLKLDAGVIDSAGVDLAAGIAAGDFSDSSGQLSGNVGAIVNSSGIKADSIPPLSGLDNAGLLAGGNVTESGSVDGSTGFAAGNTTSGNEGLLADPNAATESVDTGSQIGRGTATSIGNLPGLYGLVALILALLCGAFAWSIRN